MGEGWHRGNRLVWSHNNSSAFANVKYTTYTYYILMQDIYMYINGLLCIHVVCINAISLVLVLTRRQG